ISVQALYWINRPTATIVDISSFIRQKIKLNGEFYGIGLREIDEGLGLAFWKGKQYRKKI
ncbi:15323_t:CDS:1, partial [Entrophospora sp. SA101]